MLTTMFHVLSNIITNPTNIDNIDNQLAKVEAV